MRCKDLVELFGCKNWLDEDCPDFDKKSGKCQNDARLSAIKEILNCLADSNGG